MDKTIKNLIVIACCLFILMVVFLFFILDINLRNNGDTGIESDEGVSGNDFVGIVTLDTIVDCSSDIYNCENFALCSEVMRVYDTCMNSTGTDIHQLDIENDGIPCENLC